MASDRQREQVLDAAGREETRSEVGAGEDEEAEAAIEDDVARGAVDGAKGDVDGADVGVDVAAEEAGRGERAVDDLEADGEAYHREHRGDDEAEDEHPAPRRGLAQEIGGDCERGPHPVWRARA